MNFILQTMKKKGKYFFVSARDIYTEVFISGIQKKCGGDIHRKQGDQTQHEDDLFLLLGSCSIDSHNNSVIPLVGLQCDLKQTAFVKFEFYWNWASEQHPCVKCH